GPASSMMLSPSTVTWAVTGFRLGKWISQPLGSALAIISYLTSVLSPFWFMVFISHFPATSLSEIAAGGGGVGGGAAAVIAAESPMVSLACCCSPLEQATTRTAAQQQETSFRIPASNVEDIPTSLLVEDHNVVDALLPRGELLEPRIAPERHEVGIDPKPPR